jgi:hypothetical protein
MELITFRTGGPLHPSPASIKVALRLRPFNPWTAKQGPNSIGLFPHSPDSPFHSTSIPLLLVVTLSRICCSLFLYIHIYYHRLFASLFCPSTLRCSAHRSRGRRFCAFACVSWPCWCLTGPNGGRSMVWVWSGAPIIPMKGRSEGLVPLLVHGSHYPISSCVCMYSMGRVSLSSLR